MDFSLRHEAATCRDWRDVFLILDALSGYLRMPPRDTVPIREGLSPSSHVEIHLEVLWQGDHVDAMQFTEASARLHDSR